MPVAEQVERVDTYTGNGSTTNFAYTFRIFEDADLQVVVDDVLQVLTTHYTVNGADDAGGGSIDFITAPVNLSVVTISSELTYDRSTDYIENGAMRAETVDDDMDKGVMLTQQLRRDVKRSIKVPIEETSDQEVSLTPANRANKVLSFDASGLPTAQSITDLSTVLTSVDLSLILASQILSVKIPNREFVAGGTVDVITGVSIPVAVSLTNNLTVMVEALGANTTTTPTFNLDALGAKTIVKGNDTALEIADIVGANFRMILSFDSGLDKWVLLNPGNVASVPTLQGGTYNYVIDTGAADAYVMALVPAITAYTNGMELRTKITNANLTTTPTVNASALGAKTIKRLGGTALNVGDLPLNHQAVFRYDGTDMILLNPALHTHNGVNQGGEVAWQGLPDGAVVQVVNVMDGAVATGTTVVVVDDSIPQNDEGVEFMTLAITPKSTTNKLLVEIVCHLAHSSGTPTEMYAFLFQDTTADALAVGWGGKEAGANNPCEVVFQYYMTAGTTSPTTLKIRAGSDTAGTTTFNGEGGARLFGGVVASSITITEIKAS